MASNLQVLLRLYSGDLGEVCVGILPHGCCLSHPPFCSASTKCRCWIQNTSKSRKSLRSTDQALPWRGSSLKGGWLPIPERLCRNLISKLTLSSWEELAANAFMFARLRIETIRTSGPWPYRWACAALYVSWKMSNTILVLWRVILFMISLTSESSFCVSGGIRVFIFRASRAMPMMILGSSKPNFRYMLRK